MDQVDNLYLYEFVTLLFIIAKEREEASKLTDAEKGAMALSKAVEDNA